MVKANGCQIVEHSFRSRIAQLGPIAFYLRWPAFVLEKKNRLRT